MIATQALGDASLRARVKTLKEMRGRAYLELVYSNRSSARCAVLEATVTRLDDMLTSTRRAIARRSV